MGAGADEVKEVLTQRSGSLVRVGVGTNKVLPVDALTSRRVASQNAEQSEAIRTGI